MDAEEALMAQFLYGSPFRLLPHIRLLSHPPLTRHHCLLS